MIIKEIRGKKPQFGADCFFADTAVIIGDVEMGNQCSIWFNAILRGDVNYIRMADRVNVQDGAVIHGTYKKSPTNIGSNVSIAHNAIVHGCTIEDNVLIGMGSIVMDDCIVNSNTIIAAGAVVTTGTTVESGCIYAGVPAKKIKDISEELISGQIERIAQSYIKYAGWYK
ncbi:gamma carbonic anhydrase family protein [Desulfopila inferna]|uniref:gamma carbonic anhydrase family protein n=1 Tax=Desulfopila inferna TaxID=468528 RepID=UPI0019666EAB|nr:gamma carbonic anhydrase family protein [Desulfopila inferna]MBM9604368.1 gamma carbonic anhydrase family protein [Desulfopila inferna]